MFFFTFSLAFLFLLPRSSLVLGKGRDVGNTGPTPLADAALEEYPPGDRRFSVLSLANETSVGTKPYAHILVSPALEPKLYAALEEAYPPLSVLMALSGKAPTVRKGSNVRRDIPASISLQGYNVTEDAMGKLEYDKEDKKKHPVHPLWQRFVEYHISDKFYEDLSKLAGEHIAKFHGKKYVYGDPGYHGVQTRRAHAHKFKPSVDMDCQISFNTPVTKRSQVRGAHIDSAIKIFGALYYFKHAEDTSHGGDFSLYSCRGGCKPLSSSKVKTGNGHKQHTMFSARDTHIVTNVPYSANTFVLFINSKYAVHGVTPRSVTPYPRRLINFIGNRL